MSDYLPDLIGALGTSFKRLVRKIVLPNNAKSGQSRIEVGADTPSELVSFGILNALLFYITDKNTGVEVGYFFIGMTNSIDAGASQRALVFGNVTYPTPGNPSSPTAADVKTNFQQDQFTQNPDTIFKDHNVVLNPGISLLIDGPGNVQVAEPVATDGILTGFVTGDTVIRVQIRADGRIDWGPGGNAGLDVDLYRFVVNTVAVLKTDNDFWILEHKVARSESGNVSFTFTSQTSQTFVVTFGTPFPSAPNMVDTDINSGSGSTAGWNSRAFNITATGFTLFVFGSVSTWTNVQVLWMASFLQ